jgi:hypothetical protein
MLQLTSSVKEIWMHPFWVFLFKYWGPIPENMHYEEFRQKIDDNFNGNKDGE